MLNRQIIIYMLGKHKSHRFNYVYWYLDKIQVYFSIKDEEAIGRELSPGVFVLDQEEIEKLKLNDRANESLESSF